MVKPFEFATAGRIIFGAGKASELPAVLASLGRKAFVVTGRGTVRANLGGVDHAVFQVSGEPTVEAIREGVTAWRDSGCDVVAGIGGGSALDAAKAIAAAATNPGELEDYLEVIGKGLPLANAPLPVVAVPTTAGTGSEVTRNAVLGSPKHGVKVSLRHPLMLPRVAIVDPELTYELPAAITASTGLDALTQLIEPYVSSRANAFTDCFCPQAIGAVARALPRAVTGGRDARAQMARSQMSWGSLLGGMALANAGLGIIHALAAPIGGQFPAPHGAICAALLPYGVAANIRAGVSLERYREIACILTEDPAAHPQDGARWLQSLIHQLEIPRLASYGIKPDDWPDLAAAAARSNSMKANPVALTEKQIIEVLAAEDSATL